MAQTKEGAKKAQEKIKERYGEDYWSKIGKIGGRNSKTGGFHYMKKHDPERLREVSVRGGQNGKRGKSEHNRDLGT